MRVVSVHGKRSAVLLPRRDDVIRELLGGLMPSRVVTTYDIEQATGEHLQVLHCEGCASERRHSWWCFVPGQSLMLAVSVAEADAESVTPARG